MIFGSLGEGDFELPSGPQDLWQDGLSTRPKTDWILDHGRLRPAD